MDPFERTVLDRLLAGEHPALVTLRRQLESVEIRSREDTGCGRIVDLWVADGVETVDVGHRFAIDDVHGRLEGMREEVCFLLHVVRGRIHSLESFVLVEEWPERPVVVRLDYVSPDPDDPVELRTVETRDLAHALRGLEGDPEDL